MIIPESDSNAPVLLVEDDAATAKIEQAILTQAGFLVRSVSRVRDAVELLSRESFQAVILDYRLPDDEPWAVLTAAKAQAPEVPVILVTAAGSEEIAAEATRRGVAEYAIKGEAFWAQLPAKIRRVVRNARSEQSLRTSHALFEVMATTTSDAIAVVKFDGTIRYISAACKNLFGYEPEDLSGGQWLGFVHPDDRPGVTALLDQVGRNGHFEAEYRHLCPDGRYLWVEANGNVFRDPEGHQIEEVVVISRDISARMKAADKLREKEKSLHASEQRYHALVDGVRDYSILMLDREGRIVSWNSAAEQLNGYSEPEILGKHYSCFYRAEDAGLGRPDELLQLAAATGNAAEEGWRVRKDGSLYYATVSITAMRDEAAELQGFSKISRDITRQMESEARVRQSEEMFRALLELAPDAVVIADQYGIISLVNAQAERMFGYERPEMQGQPVELLIPGNLREKHTSHRENYEGIIPAHQLRTARELSGRRKSGQAFPAEVSLSPIHTTHGSWVAAAIRDITERKLVEQELVAARRRAEEANSAKSDFLAAMSHEIRTPMNAILGMSDLLSESDLNEEQRQYVEVFRRAGSNLLTLINDILDLSKIEAGHLELEQTEFDLRELVAHTIQLIASKAQAKGIELQSHVAPQLAPWLLGDPTRLRQVLINLLGNAIKFTDSGEVTLTVQMLPGGGDGKIEFMVGDTGVGIPEEKLETIFEDFHQGDSSTTRKYGGTGLGLGISRRIVERMGGTLSASSVVGKGSMFRFAVPLQAVAKRAQESVQVDDFHGHRVAVIDSDPTNRLILRETLAGWGFESREFASGEDAVAELKGTPPGERAYSLVILDRWTPGMDGFKLADQIRVVAPELPVIMLTSDGRPGDEALRRKCPLAGYAVRPVSRADLLTLVSTALKLLSHREPEPDTHQQNRDPPQRKGLKILIAEDSSDNRLLIQMYMKGSGHALTFVEHGKDAVDTFGSTEFDLVLMDLQMPIMDGLTATREIRAIERRLGGNALPILAISANARPLDIKMSLEAGCTAHLSKPISKSCLLFAINRYTSEEFEEEEAAVEEGVAELVPGYLNARRNDLARFAALLATSDFTEIRRLAHNMKGTGASYGFPQLTKLGAAMQLSADSSDVNALGRQIHELAAQLQVPVA